MNLSNLGTSDLISYSTILENIITTNNEIKYDIQKAIVEQFISAEEVEKLVSKIISYKTQADEKYADVQKELDLRLKRDLKIQNGIRSSQALIREYEDFIKLKNNEYSEKQKATVSDIEKISEETVKNLSEYTTMNVVTDDKI